MLFNLIIIAFICVFIIDYSGFIDQADRALTKLLKSKVQLHIPKPFSCSLCSTWWACLIYLICTSNFTLPNIALTALVCILTPEILSIIYFLKDCINKVFDFLEKYLNIF